MPVMDSQDIFAGRFSLAEEWPDEPEQAGSSFDDFAANSAAAALRGRFQVTHPPLQQTRRTEQFKPLREPRSNEWVEYVREQAGKHGIDFDGEVILLLHRMKGTGLDIAPGPHNKHSGPDPLKNVSVSDRYMAECATAELIKRRVNLTWEE
jgi:hypothetical protein